MQPRELVNGRFEIERVAGTGGMGTVYRARDHETGATVALKLLHTHSPGDGERFAREISLLAELSDPGIVRFITSGVTLDGEAFLVMEWLEGEGLHARLSRGTLSVDETIALGRRTATALHIAHARGVVHRDLKPQNIFVPGGDLARVKILDFGIARVMQSGQALTRTGATLGSPGFMSPEQTRGEKTVDARSDVFSLACVLFKCLTGQSPFTGDPLSVMIAVVKQPAPRLRSLRPDAPVALDELLDRMLAKSPDARPPHAGAVAAELAALDARGLRPDKPGYAPEPPTESPPMSVRGGTVAISQMDAPASIRYAPPSVTRPPVEPTQGFALPADLPAPASVRYPAAQAAPAPASRGGAAIVGVVGGVALLGAAAAGAYYLIPKDAEPAPSASVSAKPAASPPLQAVVTATPAACGGIKCGTFSVADPLHVDVMDVLPAMSQLAQSVDRNAIFCDLSIFGAVEGMVALPDAQKQTAGIAFSARFATGRGTHAVEVAAVLGHLSAGETACAHVAPVPVCSPRAAARAAIISGVPRTSSMLLYYHQEDASVAPVWEATVQGHPELTRKIDGRTCAVRYKGK